MYERGPLMMNKRNWIKLIVTATVLAIIAVLVYRRLYPPNRWGGGEFKQSERLYCSGQVWGLGGSPRAGEEVSFGI